MSDDDVYVKKKNVDLTNQTTIMFQISLIIIIMTFIHSMNWIFFRKWQQRMKKEKDARCFHFDRHCSNICVTRNGRITKTIDCWLLFKKMILSFCKRIVSCFSWFDFSLLLFIQSINQNEKKIELSPQKTKMSIKCMNWMNPHQDEYDDDDHWLKKKQDYVWNIHLLWWYIEHIAYIDWTHS